MNTQQIETIRRWSVLDTRQHVAEVYELAVLSNGHNTYSFVRCVLEVSEDARHSNAPKRIVHSIPIVPFGKLPNAQVLHFADEHIAYLEKNFCFCRELVQC